MCAKKTVKKAAPGVVGQKQLYSMIGNMMGGGAIGQALMFAAKKDLVLELRFKKKGADE
jgi:hypothetical protein